MYDYLVLYEVHGGGALGVATITADTREQACGEADRALNEGRVNNPWCTVIGVTPREAITYGNGVRARKFDKATKGAWKVDGYAITAKDLKGQWDHV